MVLLEDILKHAGFTGYEDRNTRVDMGRVNQGVHEVDTKMDQIQSLIMGKTTTANTNSKKVMSYIDSLTGMKLERKQVRKDGDKTKII